MANRKKNYKSKWNNLKEMQSNLNLVKYKISPVTKQILRHAKRTQLIAEKSKASRRATLSFALLQLNKRSRTSMNYSQETQSHSQCGQHSQPS